MSTTTQRLSQDSTDTLSEFHVKAPQAPGSEGPNVALLEIKKIL